MQMVNEVGRGIVNGGNRRAAIWAGLNWNHPDIFAFIAQKNWIPEVKALKEKDFNFPATMDMTNISVQLDDGFFSAYHNQNHELHEHAQKVYATVVAQMLQTGEPGFAVDTGLNAGETLRNACTEVTSYDDSDICNLGSINLARIGSLQEMRRVVELSTMFLLAGTLYSDVPYAKVDTTRKKNRRLGLGLMGIHEWLLKNGHMYGPNKELGHYLEEYAHSTQYARNFAFVWGISNPVKTRAIAPTGTIGICAETTTGIEPIFSAAVKRRYLDGNRDWAYQYVVDPTAKRLVEQGVDPRLIEDAYSIPHARRLEFQAWVQQYVDHGISSTINMPAWGSAKNNADTAEEFSTTLMHFLPRLRGITVYPDGARGGQPLNPVPLDEAMAALGTTFKEGSTVVEGTDVCDITKAGSCGS
jgi:ribonucleoside-diphosphate reductase alpha chain